MIVCDICKEEAKVKLEISTPTATKFSPTFRKMDLCSHCHYQLVNFLDELKKKQQQAEDSIEEIIDEETIAEAGTVDTVAPEDEP